MVDRLWREIRNNFYREKHYPLATRLTNQELEEIDSRYRKTRAEMEDSHFQWESRTVHKVNNYFI